ncbi:ankyrin repeat and protein kinase domain-containing protein 1 [Fagus crenata]
MASTIDQINSNPEMEIVKKDLFEKAMQGKWEKVVEIYRTNPMAHKAKLTRSGDTALHIAVSDGQEERVEELVGSIISVKRESKEIKEVLNIKNELGNTPLHNAASMGNVYMCQCIGNADKSLVGARNYDSETPFFLAALYGKKEAFLCLHELCGTENGYNYCRRKDGDTILHCAISGDYFDLAFRIIHLYKKLVNSFNQHGLTPLHILASKPSAFRSGSHFGGWYKMIYHCTFVDELENEPSDHQNDQTNQNLEVVEVEKEASDLNFNEIIIDKREPKNSLRKNQKYPENYRTCFNFLQVFRNVISFIKVQLFCDVVSVILKCVRRDAKNLKGSKDTPGAAGFNATNGARHKLFPANYGPCFEFVKLASKSMLVIFGLGSSGIRRIEEKKKKHIWAIQIMNELLHYSSLYEYDYTTGTNPLAATPKIDVETTTPYDIGDGGTVNFAREDLFSPDHKVPSLSTTDTFETKQEDENNGSGGNEKTNEAKNGITEIVEEILERFPVAIHDMNEHKKNVVLLAVENRQPHVYQLLLRRNVLRESVFRRVDHKGNSALHLSAKLGDHKPWLIPGAALQIQWEIKWHEFVKDSMPFHFFPRNNKDGKTSREIFTETHSELVKDGSQWLISTSNSCSVVAALIATVAFASSTTVPGGIKEESGTPTLENQPAFDVFAITSLVALCFSVTALVMFLSILTSRYQERDFGMDLPRKLLLGLTSLFVSIASMLISFCAGHFFVLKDKLKYAAFPVYAVTCLPITFFAIAQFPLYFDLIWAIFKKVPQRSYKVAPF